MIINLFLCTGLLQAKGFAAGSLMSKPRKLVPIECITPLGFIKNECVMAYECAMAEVNSNVVESFVRMKVGDYFVKVALDKEFYLYPKNQWVKAKDLKVSDTLYCGSSVVPIIEIKIIFEKQTMYELPVGVRSVEPYGIWSR